jgi:hypothetical protein
MPRYRSYGSLDDQPVQDGDTGFIGMNQREKPHQLKPGEVVLSRNGRMDGFWQPRRGITLKSGALSNSENPLLVPFIVINSPITIASASRTSNVVTMNFAAPHGIDSGDLPAYITVGDPNVTTQPLTGVAPGSYLMSYVDADSLSFANTGADNPALSVDATYGIIQTLIDNGATSAIYGACVWSDPSDDLQESVILATPNEAKLVPLDTYTTTSLPYPTGSSLTGQVDMIQAFDRIYLFRDGARTWEYIPQGRSVEAGSYVSGTGVVTLTLKNHGLTTGDVITVANVGFSATPTTADPNGTHTVTGTPSADTFTYVIASGSGDETYTANTGTMTAAGFTLVPGGAYTQPQNFRIAGNAYGVSGGSLRLTMAGNTTIVAGDYITIRATDVPLLEALEGQRLLVTSATSTDIYATAPVADLTYGTGSAAEYIEFGGRFTQGGGFIHMPAPAWGVYFQRRLWCPYFYQPAGTAASPTYADRDLRDEVCASDILDSNTFDTIDSQFRITAGIADSLVAMHPFYNDNMLVMNRNSIHMISGTQGSLADTVVRELTREVGCLARRSIVSQGNNVFFLSDNGVYGLSFIDEYNLRGIEEPLSKNIQPYIDRINKTLAGNAVGTYFNNRYYLALPLDSSRDADDATGNNTVLVFNMLNKGWESIDTYGTDFNVLDFAIARGGERNNLYIINTEGGLHLADANEEAQDNYSTNVTGSSSAAGIDYELTTRGYSFNQMDRKKFAYAQVHMESSQDYATDVDFLFSSESPDTDSYTVTDVASQLPTAEGLPGQLPSDESGNFRFRLGNPRGLYGSLTIRAKVVGSVSVGRPKITSVVLEGSITNRNSITQY